MRRVGGELFEVTLALAIWDNEGGAAPGGTQESSIRGALPSERSLSASPEFFKLPIQRVSLAIPAVALLP